MKFRQSGFTLIELMVVVAIAAILSSLAIPSFQTMLLKRSALSAANAFVGDMRFARTEALKRSTRVVMCSVAANSTTACSGAAGAWPNGWLIYVDLNSNGVLDAGEDVIRVQQILPNIATIQSSSPSTDLRLFSFEPNGWAKASTQTFVFTPTAGVAANATRLVCVSMQGRPSLRAEGATVC